MDLVCECVYVKGERGVSVKKACGDLDVDAVERHM